MTWVLQEESLSFQTKSIDENKKFLKQNYLKIIDLQTIK